MILDCAEPCMIPRGRASPYPDTHSSLGYLSMQRAGYARQVPPVNLEQVWIDRHKMDGSGKPPPTKGCIARSYDAG
ncbi:MAG: hypothetical protein JKY67_00070 [Pseudomonadales bacterium]|nr:hypothetical protein [Pseudomonadales bacterium]